MRTGAEEEEELDPAEVERAEQEKDDAQVTPLPSFYLSTSLIRKRTPLGPYRGSTSKSLGGSRGGERFLMSEVPLYSFYWLKMAG